MSTPEDRWLRETFDDAVADVSPHQDLADVRARIEADATHARRRRGWAAGAAGLAVAATVAAVALVTGFDGDDDAAGPATSPTAGPTGAASGTPSEPSGGETAARFDGPLAVYYVGDTPAGPRLFREFAAPATERGDPLATAVQMAVSRQPDDPDYRIPWPDGVTATAGALLEPEGVLQIDLTTTSGDLRSRPSGISQDEASAALQQLIYTAQAAVQSRDDVLFTIDGRPTDRLLGEPASEPLTERDPMQVQAPVWIIDPQDGTALSSLVVQGRGAFFEANVSWQVLQDGAVVEEGFATAKECCTLASYSFEVPDLAPGDYVLRVYDADMSDGEGPGEQEDTKRFTISE